MEFTPIQIYRGALFLQMVLAVGALGFIVNFTSPPTLELITWIEIGFFVSCVIALLESMIIAGLMFFTAKGKYFIPRYRILFGPLLFGFGVALLARTLILVNDGIPDCETKSFRRNKSEVTVILDQPPCQQLLYKILVGVASLVNAVIYGITAFINPIKSEHEKEESRGHYQDVGQNTTNL